jgi:hypothetical protein
MVAQAMDQTRTLVSRIRTDQESLPTPCTEGNVRAGKPNGFDTQNSLPRSVAGRDRRLTRTSLERTGRTPTAWLRVGSWTLGVSAAPQFGRGEVAATWVSGMRLFSEAVRGWDHASATGQSTDQIRK